MFKAEIYKKRRAALRDRLDEGIILLLGNNDSPMNYQDNIYPFRQDSNFLYLIGIDQPELAAIIDVETGKTTLFGDDLPIDYLDTRKATLQKITAPDVLKCHASP